MNALIFYTVYPLLWLISKLPFRAIYVLSDACYILVYRIIGYRKKVVRQNLALCFPEKSGAELKSIEIKFYHHLCDIFLEMIKTLDLKPEDLKERFIITNPEAIKDIDHSGKSAIVMCAHYASYEWITAIKTYDSDLRAFGIYKKIKNPYFDNMVKKIRTRFNTDIIDKNEATRTMLRNKVNNIGGYYGMVADQSPKAGKITYWGEFMGQETPMFVGSEIMAKRLDFSVYFFQIDKIRRGVYQAELILLAENPKEFENFKITEKYFELVEAQIKKAPEFYFWIHKRWKHKKENFENS